MFFWCGCGWTCVHGTKQYPLVSSIDSYLFLLTSDFSCVVCPMVPIPCWIRLAIVVDWVSNYDFKDFFDSVKVLLEAINCANKSLSGKWLALGCSVPRENLVVPLQDDWHSGILPVYNLNADITLISYTLTWKCFEIIPCLFRACLPTPVLERICVYSRRTYSMIFHS